MFKTILSVLLVLTFLSFASFLRFAPAQPDISIEDVAGFGWLEVVDHGRYAESWEMASSYFKSMVTRENWVSQVSAVRGALGEKKCRVLAREEKMNSLPGAPDGEYTILTFNTSLKNKVSAVETVTLVKDTDGLWRVAGYFIK